MRTTVILVTSNRVQFRDELRNHLLSSLTSTYLHKCEDTYFILQNNFLCIYKDSFGAKILSDDCSLSRFVPCWVCGQRQFKIEEWRDIYVYNTNYRAIKVGSSHLHFISWNDPIWWKMISHTTLLHFLSRCLSCSCNSTKLSKECFHFYFSNSRYIPQAPSLLFMKMTPTQHYNPTILHTKQLN